MVFFIFFILYFRFRLYFYLFIFQCTVFVVRIMGYVLFCNQPVTGRGERTFPSTKPWSRTTPFIPSLSFGRFVSSWVNDMYRYIIIHYSNIYGIYINIYIYFLLNCLGFSFWQPLHKKMPPFFLGLICFFDHHLHTKNDIFSLYLDLVF